MGIVVAPVRRVAIVGESTKSQVAVGEGLEAVFNDVEAPVVTKIKHLPERGAVEQGEEGRRDVGD